MTDQEKRAFETFKELVIRLNTCRSNDTKEYVEAMLIGMEAMAGAFGYALYAYNENGYTVMPYEYVMIAKDGHTITKESVKIK